MRVMVVAVFVVLFVACGLTSPPLAPTARQRIMSARSGMAWRLSDASGRGYERVGAPVVLDAATVARVRSALSASSTYGGHRVKCEFQPIVELELTGEDRTEITRLRLCFACDELVVDGPDGAREWARFVPGRRRLRALVDELFPGLAAES